MEKQEAIDYLNNLQPGMFCTVNLPLYGNEVIPITAMYIGQDKGGRLLNKFWIIYKEVRHLLLQFIL